jgi:hypothetical protein
MATVILHTGDRKELQDHSSIFLLHGSCPSWETDRRSAGQDMLHILENQKVYSRVHASPSMVTVLREMNPVHMLPSYFVSVHFNIILLSALRTSTWSLLFMLFYENNKHITKEISELRALIIMNHLGCNAEAHRCFGGIYPFHGRRGTTLQWEDRTLHRYGCENLRYDSLNQVFFNADCRNCISRNKHYIRHRHIQNHGG